MTKEQLKQALNVCSEHDACERCPAREYCGDLAIVTGEALNAIEKLEAEKKELTVERELQHDAEAGRDYAMQRLIKSLIGKEKKEVPHEAEEATCGIRLILEAKPPLMEIIEELANTFKFDASEVLDEAFGEWLEENGLGEYLEFTVEAAKK
ncbi:MAG: hypothetical protein K2L51_01030 [Clostridiales bacterium]|nr:hypothetical protein [Clostridiales bacterium]